jgi:hypothetical protein
MSERPGVDDDGIDTTSCRVDGINNLSLVIALKFFESVASI